MTLVYPDTYELGMSNHGLGILRHILLQDGNLEVRRAFCPAPDLYRAILERGLDWVDLEAGEPVVGSRVIGFSVPCESLFSNVLALVRMMGLPLRRNERPEDAPVILLGGGGLVNPMPISPFADVIFLGEAEEVVSDLVRVLVSDSDRRKRLEMASHLPGVFVPSIPSRRVEVHRVRELRREWVPDRQLVPLSRITQDRAVIEVARGCTRGCRFCQASAVARPVRERSVEQSLDLMDSVLGCTGWEKAGLLSLSFSDYSELSELMLGMERLERRHHVSIGRPSLRPDSLHRLSGSYRVTGRMTLAPEAGSERLRRMINKPITDESILGAARSAYEMGAKGVKLYFMVGLPGETMEDVEAIADLALQVGALAKKMRRSPRKSVTVALSPFVPKAHTAFQRVPMMSEQEIWERISLVRKRCGRRLTVNWNSPRVALVEGVLGLGDEHETADLLEEAVLRGACFDAWADLFRWDIWEELLASSPSLLSAVLGGRAPGEDLPWSFVDTGISDDFLREEWLRCQRAVATGDCIEVGCVGCGACDREPALERAAVVLPERSRESSPQTQPAAVLRVRYSRTGLTRFSSHLDSVRMWNRTVRRSGLPVAWSGGYVSRPRLQFGPPLPLGMESTAEYVDIHLEALPPEGASCTLQDSLPVGFDVLGAVLLPASARSPARGVSAVGYRITPEDADWPPGVVEEIIASADACSGVREAELRNDGSLAMLIAEGNRDARPDILIEPHYSGRIRIRRTGIFVESPSGLTELAPAEMNSVALGVDSI